MDNLFLYQCLTFHSILFRHFFCNVVWSRRQRRLHTNTHVSTTWQSEGSYKQYYISLLCAKYYAALFPVFTDTKKCNRPPKTVLIVDCSLWRRHKIGWFGECTRGNSALSSNIEWRIAYRTLPKHAKVTARINNSVNQSNCAEEPTLFTIESFTQSIPITLFWF